MYVPTSGYSKLGTCMQYVWISFRHGMKVVCISDTLAKHDESILAS